MLNPFFRFLRGNAPAFKRTVSRLPTKVEPLESKQLLTTSLESLSQGILSQDPVTGEWSTVRFDGSNFVTEAADEINAIGHWSDSISVDLDGNGLQEIYLRDTRTGDWWKIDPNAPAGLPTWVTYWSPTQQIQKTLTGDLNGDGRDDLLVFDQDGGWTMLSYDGNQYTVNTVSIWGSPDQWQDLTLADLNGDGTEEILGFHSQSGIWWSTSWQGGSFFTQALTSWTTANTYDHFMVGDMNGDGSQDLVAQDSLGIWWMVTRNGASYSTQFVQGWDTGTSWQNFALADTDGDGWDEVIAQDAQSGAWWGILHSGNQYYSQKLSTWNSQNTYSLLAVGDVTGDGRSDLVVRDSLGSWLALNYDGRNYQATFLRGWNTDTAWKYLHLVDVDGNGVQEVVGWDSSSGKWWGIFQTGNTYVNQQVAFWGTQAGYSDIHFGKYSSLSGESVVGWNAQGGWWLSTLARSPQTQTNVFLSMMEPRVNFTSTSLADVNGDGLQDILGWDAAKGDWWAIVKETTGTHNRFLGHVDPSVNWRYVTIADLDGDGKQDIAQWNPVTGQWWGILSTQPNPIPVVLATWGTSSPYMHFLSGDIDGDGCTDLIVQNSSGTWYASMFNGTAFRTRRLDNWNPAEHWEDLGIADLDGDGEDELFGRSGVTGDWWALEWTGTIWLTHKLEHWNPASEYTNLMIGDVTGDGRDDIVERDSIGNFWTITYNGSEYKSVFLWGWNTETPWVNVALVDLDGDGTDEIIGCNAVTLDWWGIFKGIDSYYTRLLLDGSQGLRADFVRAADLNGDGSQELVGVDRNTETAWSLSFPGGTTRVQTLAHNVDGENVRIGEIPGISDAMLRRQILLETPGLGAALENGDILQAAKLLLQWTAPAGDFALNGSVLAPEANTVAEQYYNIFLNNLGGMSCGGYAAFYSGVLQLFGIDSLNIGVGNLPLISHTTVVVPVLKQGVWKFYLLDPTFGATFQDLDAGTTATYFDLIDRLNVGTFDRIALNAVSLDQRNFLSPAPYSNHHAAVVLQGHNSLNYIYSWPGYGLAAYLGTCDLEMVASGFSVDVAGFVQLLSNHVYMVQTYGGTAGTALAAFVDELEARNIPCDV